MTDSLPPDTRCAPSLPARPIALRRPAPLDPFDAEVELQLAACRRHGVRAGVIVLRLKGAAALAEQHGASFMGSLGDIARQRLRHRLRHVDRIARISDDTFGVALFDARPNTCPAIEQRLREELSAPYCVDDHLVSVQAVSGVALARGLGGVAADLIHAADAACRAQAAA